METCRKVFLVTCRKVREAPGRSALTCVPVGSNAVCQSACLKYTASWDASFIRQWLLILQFSHTQCRVFCRQTLTFRFKNFCRRPLVFCKLTFRGWVVGFWKADRSSLQRSSSLDQNCVKFPEKRRCRLHCTQTSKYRRVFHLFLKLEGPDDHDFD